MAWLESIAGQTYATAMMWTLGALLLLLVVLLLIKIVRSLTFGTFVSGGRNRKARLAVMDAAAVDSHRRLVLVRRDDVEHLILIGGPTDVVVEQNIRLAPSQRRNGEEPAREPARENGVEERPRPPAAAPHPAASQRPPEPAAAPATAEPRMAEPAASRIAPVARPPQASAMPPRPTAQPAAIQPQPRPPVSPPPARPAPAPAAVVPPVAEWPAPAPASAPAEPVIDLDDALREELEVTLDERKQRSEDDLPESVEDEMSKLLGELSRTRR